MSIQPANQDHDSASASAVQAVQGLPDDALDQISGGRLSAVQPHTAVPTPSPASVAPHILPAAVIPPRLPSMMDHGQLDR